MVAACSTPDVIAAEQRERDDLVIVDGTRDRGGALGDASSLEGEQGRGLLRGERRAGEERVGANKAGLFLKNGRIREGRPVGVSICVLKTRG